jgi:hypothetical protein
VECNLGLLWDGKCVYVNNTTGPGLLYLIRAGVVIGNKRMFIFLGVGPGVEVKCPVMLLVLVIGFILILSWGVGVTVEVWA